VQESKKSWSQKDFQLLIFVDYSRKRFKVAKKFIVFFSRIDLIDTDEAASDP